MNTVISSMAMRPFCFMCTFFFFFGTLITYNNGQQHATWPWTVQQASIQGQGQKTLTYIFVCCECRWIKEVTPTHHWKGPETMRVQEQDRPTAQFQLYKQCESLDDICHLPRVAAWLGPETQEWKLQNLTLTRQLFGPLLRLDTPNSVLMDLVVFFLLFILSD